MTDLQRRISDEARRLDLEGTRALVAVSGGGDSIALLRLLLDVQSELSLTIVAAHLDHGLRGAQSARDAAWVRDQCRRLNVDLELETTDVAARANGVGIEEGARHARYSFLTLAAQRRGCTHIAVAHTADDQAETVLHHIVRGTGLAGLRGIPRTRDLGDGLTLIRPLLDVRRDEIQIYLSEREQEFLSDESNLDTRFTRNRIRHALLPLLRSEFNLSVDEALRRLSTQAEDMQQAVELVANRIFEEALVQIGTDFCRIACAKLGDEPVHFVREGFRLLWTRMDWPLQRMDYAHWNRLAQLVREDGACDLPQGITARRRKYVLEIERINPRAG